MELQASELSKQENMKHFCFMIKSYSKDIKYVERLISSISKFNQESIKTFIIIPEIDFADFKKFTSDLTEIIFEENVPTLLATSDVNNYRKGYINQAILKMAFHRLNLASSYMCLDSDFEFIRPFTYSDFLTSSGEPYTVLIEDNESKVDKIYFPQYWIGRASSLSKILRFYNLDEKEIWLTCHNGQIFSQEILRKLDKEILKQRNMDYLDLLKISPYEFSWYNFYLQSSGTSIRIREPYFKIFHTNYQLGFYQSQKITTQDIARGYVGVVVNSNFQGSFGPVNLDDNFYKTATHFLRYREIILILIFKLTAHFRQPRKVLKTILNMMQNFSKFKSF
jgi:hypothetical protein